jgi:hypothetical protein
MSFPVPIDTVIVGGIPVTPTQILTPIGAFDRATTIWTFGQLRPLKATPGILIAFAVVLAPCTGLLSLLLLLVKEHNGQYLIDLTLNDGRSQFRTMIHVGAYDRYLDLARLAAWAQGMHSSDLARIPLPAPTVLPLRRTAPWKIFAWLIGVTAACILALAAISALLR